MTLSQWAAGCFLRATSSSYLSASLILGAVLVRQEADVLDQIRPSKDLAEFAKEVVVSGTDDKVLVRRLEHIEGRDGWMPISDPVDRLAVGNGLHHAMLQHHKRRVEHRDIDMRALSGLFTSIERARKAAETEHPTAKIREGRAKLGWRAIRVSGHAHDAAHGLDNGVVSRIRGKRSRLAIPR